MKCDAIVSPSSKFYQKPLEYAMSKYAYYVCYKCKKVGLCCYSNSWVGYKLTLDDPFHALVSFPDPPARVWERDYPCPTSLSFSLSLPSFYPRPLSPIPTLCLFLPSLPSFLPSYLPPSLPPSLPSSPTMVVRPTVPKQLWSVTTMTQLSWCVHPAPTWEGQPFRYEWLPAAHLHTLILLLLLLFFFLLLLFLHPPPFSLLLLLLLPHPLQVCPKHSTDFLEYKCRYCCSVAVYFCFGTTHFCSPCHDDFQRLTGMAKSELPQCPVGPCAKPLEGMECPLHVKHPPTGEEFALGCGVCRNAQTF